jgi:hypothetical protein
VRELQKTLLCLTLALSALAVGLALSPGLAAAVGLDLWKTPEGFDAAGADARGDDPIDEQIQAAQRRTAAKSEVAGEALEGRWTLLEAAARFRDLDAAAPEGYRRAWRSLVEGATDEERYCRQVLDYSATVARDRSDDPAALDRLRAQLEAALSRGDLRLPD